MTLELETFINKRIDIIDTEQWMQLFLEAYDDLSNEDTAELISVLSQIDIDYKKLLNDRDSALRFILTMIFEDLSPGQYFPSSLTGQHLKQYLGLSSSEIKKFIYDEAAEWPANIQIVSFSNSTVGAQSYVVKVN